MDPWSQLLCSVLARTICSTCHSASQVTPGQLMFDRDMLLNLQFVADWEEVFLNNTVRVQNGTITECINIVHCFPYTD